MKHKNLMAKALYDNVPESPEELAFRKGEILTVIEQNTGGLEGWWLCSLHGRQGIAPGNRLKLLIGPLFEGQTHLTQSQSLQSSPVTQAPGYGPRPQTSQGLYHGKGTHLTGIYQVPPAQDVYQVPQRSAHLVHASGEGTPAKVVTPIRVGNTYTYRPVPNSQQDVYDVPPARQQGVYDVPQGRHQVGKSHGKGLYDIPPASQTDSRLEDVYDVPPSSHGPYPVAPCRSNPVQEEGNYDFPQPHKGISSQQEGIYDVPPPSSQSKATQFPPKPPSDSLRPANCNVDPNANVNSHRRLTHSNSNAIYDVPPSQLSVAAGTGMGLGMGFGVQRDLYDIPRGMQTPPSQRRQGPQASSADRDSDRERERANRGVYDVPVPDMSRLLGDVTDGVNRLSFSSTGSTRSSMSTSSSSAGGGSGSGSVGSVGCGSSSSPSDARLALDLDTAVQHLGHLQQAVEATCAALLAMASSPHWRTVTYMERHGVSETKAALENILTALGDLLAFGRGAAANATALSDPGLHAKLRRQLQRLEDSQHILTQTHQALDACGWALHVLAIGGGSLGGAHARGHQGKNDELDRFVMVSHSLPDDAKQLCSTVGTNAELLFRRRAASPTDAPGTGTYYRGLAEESVGIVYPLTHSHVDDNLNEQHVKPFPVHTEKSSADKSERCVKSWMEDYDYVHLQGKEEFERQQKELLDKEDITKQKIQLEQEQLNKLKQLEQEVIKPVENDITQWISHHNTPASSSSTTMTPPDSSSSSSTSCSSVGGGASQMCGRDRQLLCFYADQCEQHFVTLLNAIDAFFGCVAAGQPPRIFVAHSKFVILSAHKLVFIGDTLSRQAAVPDVANRVMNSSNVLCDLLKTVVGSTKMAALSYPNTPLVQEMVDRVAELSHQAQQFKTQLHHMAAH